MTKVEACADSGREGSTPVATVKSLDYDQAVRLEKWSITPTEDP